MSAPTDTVLITPAAASKDFFTVPKRIVKDGKLTMLSGDSMALYLFLAYAMYRRKRQARWYANGDLARTLDMPLDALREARQELRAHQLIGYKPSKDGNMYWFSLTPTPQTTLNLAVTKPHS